MPYSFDNGTVYFNNAVIGRIDPMTVTRDGVIQMVPAGRHTVTASISFGEIERRAWAAYVAQFTPVWSHTATGRAPTQMTNYIATTRVNDVTTFTATSNFTQPLTRLYAATTGGVVNGPYVGFDEAEATALWAAACRPIPRPSGAEIRRRRAAKLKAGKRALRRSIDIYAKLRGMDEIARFLRGQEIILPGCAFDYRVRKTLSVLEHTMNPVGGHTPYQLEITRKDTPSEQRALGSGCIYFERTPVIDQILAVSMHVADADEEQRLIRTANWRLYNPRDHSIPEMLRRNYR